MQKRRLVCSAAAQRSRVDLLGDDGEDDVLVAAPHHRPQFIVPPDGGADVAGRGDPLAVDADDDVALLQAGPVQGKYTNL